MKLALYDLSGIQKFIFENTEIKNITGASYIAHISLFTNLPLLLKIDIDEVRKKLENHDFDEFLIYRINKPDYNYEEITIEGENNQIVFIGGGNAEVLYKDDDNYRTYTSALQEILFLQTNGKLKMFFAAIDFCTNPDFKYSVEKKKLMDALEEQKKNGKEIFTAKGISINDFDNKTFEPIKFFEKIKDLNTSKFSLGELPEEFSTSSDYLKQLAYSLKEVVDGSFFGINRRETRQYSVFFEEKNDDKSGKNYLGIVHLDGNTMGKSIREFIDAIKTSNIFTALTTERKMSIEINNIYKKTFDATISKMEGSFAKEKGDTIPFRPIILDGDDVTIIAKSQLAWEFSVRFVNELQDQKQNVSDELKTLFEKVSVGIGVAFCKNHFPFYTAYEIAESCCKNAKSVGVEISKTNGFPINSIDYHICYAGFLGSVSEYREKYQSFGDHYLSRKPLVFENVKEKIREFDGFNKLLSIITDESIPKSRVKDLRDAYGQGESVVKNYYAQFVKTIDENLLKGVKGPFEDYSINEKVTRYLGTLFDPIDVMDIVSPITDFEPTNKNTGASE